VYRAGIAAPVLLALLRILQGLALGGEHSSAMCYISELADKGQRGRFTAVLQWCVNIGMIIATLMAMMLQNTLSEGAPGIREGVGRSRLALRVRLPDRQTSAPEC
jgi:MFS family permease